MDEPKLESGQKKQDTKTSPVRHEGYNMYKPIISPFAQEVAQIKELKFKEWVYFCHYCRWIGEKNAIMVNKCPQCFSPLHFVYEDVSL